MIYFCAEFPLGIDIYNTKVVRHNLKVDSYKICCNIYVGILRPHLTDAIHYSGVNIDFMWPPYSYFYIL
jgi:hypothetical protein